jgi:hypothetical protein
MKRAIALSVVASIALLAAGTTSASPNWKARASREARALRHAKATIAQLRASVATLRSSLQAATEQNATDQSTISSLRSQIPTSTPFEIAVNDVKDESAWAGGGPQAIALAAMDYTIGHIRTGMYGYLEGLYHEAPGGPDLPSYYAPIDSLLAAQTGICLHAERVFGAIVSALGLPVRDVGFNYTEPDGSPDAHATAEVFYAGGWHWFDPTFGVYYKDATGNALSIADVRLGLGTRVKDDAAFVNVVENPESKNGDTTWFETDPATTVVYVAQPS